MGGVWYKPHLVKTAGHAEPVRRADLHPENIATVVSGMYGVVNEGGTGASARIAGTEICAARPEPRSEFRWSWRNPVKAVRTWRKRTAGS